MNGHKTYNCIFNLFAETYDIQLEVFYADMHIFDFDDGKQTNLSYNVLI